MIKDEGWSIESD